MPPKRPIAPVPRRINPVVYIGIDPGASGGLVAVDRDGIFLSARTMLPSEKDIWEWFQYWAYTYWREVATTEKGNTVKVFAVIEQVGGFIGGEGNTGSSMFKFGASYGGLRMAITAAEIPFEAVTPQKWQKTLGMFRKKGEAKGVWKNRLKAKAQQLYPKEKITLSVADAVLIAEYCRRLHEGRL